MRTNGFSLLEVLIALAVLAIGILAIVQLQASSLSNSALAREIADTTRVVRSEIEFRRFTSLLFDEGADAIPEGEDSGVVIEDLEEGADVFAVSVPCSGVPDRFESCVVRVSACEFNIGSSTSASTIECDLPVDGDPIVGTLFSLTEVTAVNVRGHTFALPAIASGVFVAGRQE